jgi:hypothetical protein
MPSIRIRVWFASAPRMRTCAMLAPLPLTDTPGSARRASWTVAMPRSSISVAVRTVWARA